jgi:hypothetical protein
MEKLEVRKFVVVNDKGLVLKVKCNNIIWLDALDPVELEVANTYTSKYAAKKHLRTLDNVPEGVKIVELTECSSVR